MIAFQAVAVVILSLIINESLGQPSGGRRGNRPLRQRQRQGRILAAQNPLGPPPQPAILLDAAPIFIDEPAPRQGRAQTFRQGRQFDDGVSSGSIPDEDGNYNFE